MSEIAFDGIDQLPAKFEKRMKILYVCQFFSYCSGSAMYVHNVAMKMKKRGHDVTIFSEMGGEIANSAASHGIKLVDFSQIFSIQDEKYDIMHLQQYYPSEMALEFFDFPAVFTCHSELDIEKPYIHKNIKKYIAVREAIAEKYKDLHPIIIPIPVDLERFNTKNEEKVKEVKKKANQVKKLIIYIGTIDRLREQMIRDMAERAITENFDFWVVGRNMLNYRQPEHVVMMPETFFVEKYYELADEIVGIQRGTSMFEAWACGKPYIHYEVDNSGKILSRVVEPVPKDLKEYDLKTIVDTLEKVYNEAML